TEDDALPVEQGVLGTHQLEVAALEGGQHGAGGLIQASGLAHGLHQALSQDIHLTVGSTQQHIVEVGVDGNGVVAGDGPGGGGPNDEVGLRKVGDARKLALVVLHGELHEDGGAGVVGV